MKTFDWKAFFIGISLAIFFIGGYMLSEKQNSYYKSQARMDSIKIPPPIDSNYNNVKSWDYQNKKWNTYEPFVKIPKSRNYSDEEIRILREKQSFKNDGSYIYTPGRHVPTREEEIQNYIDEHGDEIYEELQDKYGN